MVQGITQSCARICAALVLMILAPVMALACTLPELHTNDRPGTDGKPVPVTLSIVVADLLGVNDVQQQLDIDLYVHLSWTDPRLAGMDGCRFPVTEVWVPRIKLLNSSNLRQARTNARNDVAVHENGRIVYEQRLTGNISSYHRLEKFPFDRHVFQINLITPNENHSGVEFVADQENTWIADRLNIEGWKVGNVALSVGERISKPDQLTQSQATLSIAAKRNPEYYLYRVLLLLTIVVAMSWIIFWVPPSRFEFQIGIGATSMLTAIAFNLALAGRLPTVGYLTTLDRMVIWAILLVLLSILEALVAGRWVLAGKEERAIKLDLLSRFAFPALLFGGWALMIVFA